MYLHEKFPHLKVAASEALQCPTLLNNGFGDHRIEGIGDKHVPFVLNAKDQDVLIGIDDEHAMSVFRLFNTPEGHNMLKKHGVEQEVIDNFENLGISGVANILGLIKMAHHFELTEKDVLITLATDSAVMYGTRLKELDEIKGPYTEEQAYADWFRFILGQDDAHMEELTYTSRKRIHNLKYYTWVEQQGKELDELNDQWYDDDYWKVQMGVKDSYDKLIKEFNQKTGLLNEYQ